MEYETKVEKLFQEHRPPEVSLRFDTKNRGCALMRRDGRQNNHAMLGLSNPPYKPAAAGELSLDHINPFTTKLRNHACRIETLTRILKIDRN